MEMALRVGCRQSWRVCSLPGCLQSASLQLYPKQAAAGYRFNHNHHDSNHGPSQGFDWSLALKVGAVAGLTAISLDHCFFKREIKAEEKAEDDLTQVMIDQENR